VKDERLPHSKCSVPVMTLLLSPAHEEKESLVLVEGYMAISYKVGRIQILFDTGYFLTFYNKSQLCTS
jgi:hypothetical protein